MAKEKINTKDFTTCPIEKWNGYTFREYVKHLNRQKYGIPCVSNNVVVENSMIKNFTNEYGNETAKAFFEECIKSHRGTDQYPTCNIGFMITYMKASILPRVLNQAAKKNKIEELREQLLATQQDNVENYF